MLQIPKPIVRAQGFSIRSPVKGWNANDSIDAMPPGYAIQLDNFFPETSYCRMRRGYRTFCDTGRGTKNVATLMTWAGGSQKLLAACDGRIFDVTSGSASLLASGYASDYWSWTAFSTGGGQYVIAVNGADTGWRYDGTTLTALVNTGPSNPLSLCLAYSNRMFYAEKNTLKVWYAQAGAFQGSPLSSFDFGPFCSRGGSIAGLGTWTRDNGFGGSNELFVMVTTMGEVLVYSGFDPASTTTWTLIARYLIGRPVSGPGCITRIGPDMLLICEDGFQPLSSYLSVGQSKAQEIAISKNIGNAVSAVVASGASSSGWGAMLYPQGTQLIVNVPTQGTYHQYVVNTITGAWCRYTGLSAVSWGLLNSAPYFGSTDGKVYLWDTGTIDGTADIVAEMVTGYEYVGGRGIQKRFTMARPVLQTTGPFTYAMDVEVDFETRTTLPTISSNLPAGAAWDSAVWDSSSWSGGYSLQRNWVSVEGLGYAAAIHLKASSQTMTMNVMSFDVTYEKGLFI